LRGTSILFGGSIFFLPCIGLHGSGGGGSWSFLARITLNALVN